MTDQQIGQPKTTATAHHHTTTEDSKTSAAHHLNAQATAAHHATLSPHREKKTAAHHTTVIKGKVDWEPCIKKASALILDIYNYHDHELQDELKPLKAEIPQYWERGWSVGIDISTPQTRKKYPKDSGLFARIYYPKIPQGKTKDDVCPPVLVFRGSEMNPEDKRSLAVNIEIRANIRITGRYWLPLRGWSQTEFNLGDYAPSIPTLSLGADINGSASRQDLRKIAGLHEEALILPSRGQTQLPLTVMEGYADGTATINWEASASLFYGTKGDWPTNIAQGLGKQTAAYNKAMRCGIKAAREAMAEWNGRLIIVGHSLGGGVASAAAIAARGNVPALKLAVRTYNAAGLHSNTASQVKGASLNTANEIPIRPYCVAGDILTSLQTQNMIPLVSSLFKWAKKSMPPAVANPAITQGLSPGKMMLSGLAHAPKGNKLPQLFPVERQSKQPGYQFAILHEVFALAEQAPNFERFVHALINYLLRRLSTDRDGNITATQLSQAALAFREIDFSAFANEIAQAIKTDGPLPSNTRTFGTSDYNVRVLTPFINGLIRDMTVVGKIFYAAVDYHMFDSCAFTFLLDK